MYQPNIGHNSRYLVLLIISLLTGSVSFLLSGLSCTEVLASSNMEAVNSTQLLPDTTYNIHVGLPFNFSVNPINEAGKVDIVWASKTSNEPSPIYNTFYYPFERDGDKTHTLTWWQQNHPDWIEYKCDQVTPAYEFNDPNIPLNINNPDVLNYMMQTTITGLLQKGFPGVAFDNVNLENLWGRCGHYSPQGIWVQQYTGSQMDPAYTQTVLNWAQNIRTMIHDQSPQASIVMNFEYDPSLDNASKQLFRYMDVDLDERGFTNWGFEGNNYITDGTWVTYMTAMQTIMDQGVGLFTLNNEPESFTSITSAEVQWALANYLLLKNQHSYVYIGGKDGYGKLNWLPEYQTQIGAPVSSMEATQQVYTREYTRGMVLVNPSSTNAYSIQIPKTNYIDFYGNSYSNGQVTLAPHSGLILINPSAPPVPASNGLSADTINQSSPPASASIPTTPAQPVLSVTPSIPGNQPSSGPQTTSTPVIAQVGSSSVSELEPPLSTSQLPIKGTFVDYTNSSQQTSLFTTSQFGLSIGALTAAVITGFSVLQFRKRKLKST